MRPDREWMYNRLDGKFLSSFFVEKVDEFIRFACGQHNNLQADGMLKCPCNKCWNIPYWDIDTIKLHLYKNGFRPQYYQWTYHGEEHDASQVVASTSSGVSNPYREMVIDAYGYSFCQQGIHELTDVEEEPNSESKMFFDMLKTVEQPLYEGCGMSLLSVAARITNLKCEDNIPHKAIDGFASLIKEICPDDSKMTETFYGTRRLLDGLQLPVTKFDVCPNGCMLFWKEWAHLDGCQICNADRFKSRRCNGKRAPQKQLIYFPITPRLQRLYATKSTAESMIWYAKYPRASGVMSHPFDGEAWKHLDNVYPTFASEKRNVRLGLCTDGFAPFGKSGKQYSCWPVILTPYNLPPWLCMKRPFMFLTMIIPGPKSPKGNIDVFLQPLIEELKLLWNVGVTTYDVLNKTNFLLRAAVLWTVSNFPAYGMLSGWSTAGRLACPYCMENTKSFTLKYGRKQTWFDCHRQFLPDDHIFRNNKSAFIKNRVERSRPPLRLSGMEIWERVSMLPKSYEQSSEDQGTVLAGFHICHNWTKQSIFWELPYWKHLLVRHNLDVMHIEKNVFDNLFYTIMGDKGKSKDNINARKDLKQYCKHQKLELVENVVRGGRHLTTMPKAPYTLTKEQRKLLCEWVKTLKFPDGYASNITRCVDLKEYKLYGMKSHDCHVFMERLLPVALKDLLSVHVWKAVTEISQFFRDLCSPTVREDDMLRLENNVPEIICKLERIFPPGVFNSMEHLPIHLPYEARVGGPVQYRWMYSFERFLYHLKRKIGNKAHVEGSICNAYLTEEISNFCTHYFEPQVDTKARNPGRNFGRVGLDHIDPSLPEIFSCSVGYATTEGHVAYLDERDYNIAHGYILANCGIFGEYERKFEDEMIRTNPALDVGSVWANYQDLFRVWFKECVLNSTITDDVISALALGPLRRVCKFNQYYINGFHFYTLAYGRSKSTMNYGVCVRALDSADYYGILEDVVELVYVGRRQSYKTMLFKCDWFDSEQGANTHAQYKLVEVNLMKRYLKYDPFVLSYQVQQVYFAPYPNLRNNGNQWWAVFRIKARETIDAQVDNGAFQDESTDDPPSLSDPTQQDDAFISTEQWETDEEDVNLLDDIEENVEIMIRTDEDDDDESDEEEDDDNNDDYDEGEEDDDNDDNNNDYDNDEE